MRDTGDGMLSVHPSELRAAVPDLTEVAAALGDTLTRLRNALADEGTCWGYDETGAAFGRAYQPASEEVQQAFGALAEAIGTIGADLVTIADRSEAADELARARFR
jgi:uncharacterized protein YukE